MLNWRIRKVPSLLLSTKYNKWICSKPSWLRKGEIPADPIFGLRTQNNTLSVWLVDNNTARIRQITVALAVGKQKLQEFEYVLLDSKTVTDIGIKTLPTKGKSPDHELNKNHLDLIEISAQKLLKLAETLLEKVWQEDTSCINRIQRKTVARYIIESIGEGRIDSESVNPKVLTKAKQELGHPASKKS